VELSTGAQVVDARARASGGERPARLREEKVVRASGGERSARLREEKAAAASDLREEKVCSRAGAADARRVLGLCGRRTRTGASRAEPGCLCCAWPRVEKEGGCWCSWFRREKGEVAAALYCSLVVIRGES
jgi:hypothetical protein